MINLLKIILLILTTKVFAVEIFEAKNGDIITTTISSTNLTRIEIQGQKIIKDYSSADLSKKITKPLGQIYLIPNTNSTFNLYIVSDSGNTYNLKLTPSKNAHGDSIVIKPMIFKTKNVAKFNLANQTYVRNINYLIEVMFLNKEDNEYDVSLINQAVNTYSGLDSVLLKTYNNDFLNGEVYLIKNISKTKILLSEAQFYSSHTLAVAIENPELKVSEITRIFIVKEASRD